MNLTIHNAQVHRVTEWRRKSTLDDNRIKIANLRESNETEREEVIKDTLNNNIILNEEYVDFGKDASSVDYVLVRLKKCIPLLVFFLTFH